MIEKIRRMPAPRGFRKASARAAFGPIAVKQSSVAGMTSPVLFAICGNVGLTQEREPLNTRTALRALRSRRRLAEAAKIPEPGEFLFCCVREWCSEREVYGGDVNGEIDRARFASIVVPHLSEAFALACWLTGSRADAEDVVQDASLRAFRAIASFNGTNARAWVLTIVRNTAYSWLEKNRAPQFVSVQDLGES